MVKQCSTVIICLNMQQIIAEHMIQTIANLLLQLRLNPSSVCMYHLTILGNRHNCLGPAEHA